MEVIEYEKLRDGIATRTESANTIWKRVSSIEFNELFEESERSFENRIIKRLEEFYEDHVIDDLMRNFIVRNRKMLSGLISQLKSIESSYEDQKKLFNDLLQEHGKLVDEFEIVKKKSVEADDLKKQNKEMEYEINKISDEYSQLLDEYKELQENLMKPDNTIDLKERFKERFRQYMRTQKITLPQLENPFSVGNIKSRFKKLIKDLNIPEGLLDGLWLDMIDKVKIELKEG